MSPAWRLGFRNVRRNRKRSLITALAIGVGVGALIFIKSFLAGAHHQMVRNITSTLTGDVQILPEALQNVYNTNDFIEDPAPMESWLAADSRVAGFAKKTVRGGVVASPMASLPVFVLGIDADRERAFGGHRTIVQGREIGTGDVSEVVVGVKILPMLDVSIGDKVVVTVQDLKDGLSGEALTVVGAFETGNDQIDNGTVMIPLVLSQRLLGTPRAISKFTVKVARAEDMASLVMDLNRQEFLTAHRFKAVTWEEIIPQLAQLMKFQNGMIYVIVSIILLVVCIGILNTLMMAFVERIREFGLMMALGAEPGAIRTTLVVEAMVLTMAGSFAGLVLGVGLCWWFGKTGVDLSPFGSTLSNFMIGSRVHPHMDAVSIGMFIGMVALVNTLMALYPAWRASRLEPLRAIKHAG